MRWMAVVIVCPRGYPHLSLVVSKFLRKLAIRGANLAVKREKREETADGEGGARGSRARAA